MDHLEQCTKEGHGSNDGYKEIEGNPSTVTATPAAGQLTMVMVEANVFAVDPWPTPYTYIRSSTANSRADPPPPNLRLHRRGILTYLV